MQFKVPQNVEAEDKLIGPVSLRQLIVLSAGGAITYFTFLILNESLPLFITIWPTAFFAILTVAFAFFKKDNKSFTKMSLLVTEYFINPRKRFYVAYADSIHPFRIDSSETPTTPAAPPAPDTLPVANNLSAISAILDSSGLSSPTPTQLDNLGDEDFRAILQQQHGTELAQHANKISNIAHPIDHP